MNEVTVSTKARPQSYVAGSFWLDAKLSETYMLCRVTYHGETRFVAVSLRDGVQWCSPSTSASQAVNGLDFLSDSAKLTVEAQ